MLKTGMRQLDQQTVLHGWNDKLLTVPEEQQVVNCVTSVHEAPWLFPKSHVDRGWYLWHSDARVKLSVLT
jgi:hypothetical protein